MLIGILLGIVVLIGLGLFCYGVEQIERSHRERLGG